MIFEPTAGDLDVVDVETALLRAAVGDYAAEAAVLLLANAGHWLPQLQGTGLITLEQDAVTGDRWAQIQWGEVDQALAAGRIFGSSGQVRVLRAAAGLADGQPVDLADLATGLDRPSLILLLAAIAHAGGSHEHREEITDEQGIVRLGDKVPPLVSWPTRT